jgi:hypothetical protein
MILLISASLVADIADVKYHILLGCIFKWSFSYHIYINDKEITDTYNHYQDPLIDFKNK